MCGITKYRLKALLAMQVVLFSLKGQIITTIAGTGVAGYNGDNISATSAQLNYPTGVSIDTSGNIYIAEQTGNRVRKISTSGIITTIAGTGTAGYSGDNGEATAAELNAPTRLTIDDTGNIYIADQSNNRVRKINTFGIITTIAGIGTSGYGGDNGQATLAILKQPSGLAFDNMSNLYICDVANYRIRKISTNGIITSIAGNGIMGNTGNGGYATAAEFNEAGDITSDVLGNLYIADEISNIREVNTSGIINNIAGTGIFGYSGDNGIATAAELNAPTSIVIDISGNLFISDMFNNRVRKINNGSIITTVVGTGTSGYNGEGISATSAELDNPVQITLDKFGNLYIADANNNRIRKVSNVGQMGIKQVEGNNGQVTVYPNPNNGSFSISSSISIDEIKITDMLGQVVYETKPNAEKTTLQLDNSGVYFITITAGKEITTQKVIVNK
jgi:hypothetical protein